MLEVMFLKGWTLGIKPVIFFGFVSLFDAAAVYAFLGMPLMAVFAKLMPTSIESSMFALMTGLINLSLYFLSKLIGNLWNKLFFNVTNENLTELWKLFVLQTILSLVPIAFIWILPNRQEVEAVQKRIKDEVESQETTDNIEEIEIQKVSDDNEISAI